MSVWSAGIVREESMMRVSPASQPVCDFGVLVCVCSCGLAFVFFIAEGVMSFE